MEQKTLSIYNFKRGDIITRVIPSKPIKIFGDEIEDRAYIGAPLVFVAIANGCLYVERNTEKFDDLEFAGLGEIFKKLIGKDGPINLPLDVWDDGWTYYIDPYTLTEKSENSKQNKDESVEDLEEMLNKALIKEDYIEANKIKDRLNRRK